MLRYAIQRNQCLQVGVVFAVNGNLPDVRKELRSQGWRCNESRSMDWRPYCVTKLKDLAEKMGERDERTTAD